MRIANADGRAVIVTRRDQVGVPVEGVDIEHASSGRFACDPQEVFRRWATFTQWAADADLARAAVTQIDRASLGPPVPRPRQVFAIGLNYASHAAESGLGVPASPAVFTKFPACLCGPFTPVQLPTSAVDWEVELVVVLGHDIHRLGASQARQAIAGFTIGQDLSERAVQFSGSAPQFSLGKSFPGFGPTGPAVVTLDELDDPAELPISCDIDGDVMQKDTTANLIFSVPELLARLSAVTPMLAGDLVFTGTPAGVGAARTARRFLRPGELLTSRIGGLGMMATPLIPSER